VVLILHIPTYQISSSIESLIFIERKIVVSQEVFSVNLERQVLKIKIKGKRKRKDTKMC